MITKPMKLVRIADLAGQDIAGLRADWRTRNADGSMRYLHTKEAGPVMVKMKRVFYEMRDVTGPAKKRYPGKTKLRWLQWECQSHPSGCGYSAVLAEDEEHLDRYILIEERG